MIKAAQGDWLEDFVEKYGGEFHISYCQDMQWVAKYSEKDFTVSSVREMGNGHDLLEEAIEQLRCKAELRRILNEKQRLCRDG